MQNSLYYCQDMKFLKEYHLKVGNDVNRITFFDSYIKKICKWKLVAMTQKIIFSTVHFSPSFILFMDTNFGVFFVAKLFNCLGVEGYAKLISLLFWMNGKQNNACSGSRSFWSRSFGSGTWRTLLQASSSWQLGADSRVAINKCHNYINKVCQR